MATIIPCCCFDLLAYGRCCCFGEENGGKMRIVRRRKGAGHHHHPHSHSQSPAQQPLALPALGSGRPTRSSCCCAGCGESIYRCCENAHLPTVCSRAALCDPRPVCEDYACVMLADEDSHHHHGPASSDMCNLEYDWGYNLQSHALIGTLCDSLFLCSGTADDANCVTAVLTWGACYPCVIASLLARHSDPNGRAHVGHLFAAVCCCPFALCVARDGRRVAHGVPRTCCDPVGDACAVTLCFPCVACQMCRASQRHEWDPCVEPPLPPLPPGSNRHNIVDQINGRHEHHSRTHRSAVVVSAFDEPLVASGSPIALATATEANFTTAAQQKPSAARDETERSSEAPTDPSEMGSPPMTAAAQPAWNFTRYRDSAGAML